MIRPRSCLSVLLLSVTLAPAAVGAQSAPPPGEGPDFRDVVGLRSVGAPAMSPDGRAVAYTVNTTNWDKNRYDSEIWLARDGEAPIQLTRTPDGSSGSPRWSPDGRWLAFTSGRDGASQLHLIDPRGGEAVAVTAAKDGVGSFRWAPDGRRIALAITEPADEDLDRRKKLYGDFEIEDAQHRMTHLWVLEIDPADPRVPEPAPGCGASEENGDEGDDGADRSRDDCPPTPGARRLTDGAFTVGAFEWSPDGRSIAYDRRPDPSANSYGLTDIALADVGTGSSRPLVATGAPEASPIWSPDGRWIAFALGASDTTSYYYMNTRIARVPAGGGAVEALTEGFDEDAYPAAWFDDGIRFGAWQRTSRSLFRLDPETGRVAQLGAEPRLVFGYDFSADGRHVAFHGATAATLGEIYRTDVARWSPARITDMSAQIAGWPIGEREVVSWQSEDGATIEGVLWKPAGYDPSRRYPLLVAIHGGPTGISFPQAVGGYVYPYLQWLAKGAVVLEPNYRGSAGYGEAFRSLNVRNLGVGDAWDVLSGVRHLVDRGIAHPDSMGAMGWSQGGYISAFLTTTSDAFRAISVGAGISDWMTYYVNTDIHPFTRQYLKGTPWDDPEIYAKTSPMTYITDASTPTLIQHGEFDRRVPIPNAYQLYQGLQDVGVPVELIVYKGFGHGINKPRERLAAMWHNWQWFGRWIWGERIELPLEEPAAMSN